MAMVTVFRDLLSTIFKFVGSLANRKTLGCILLAVASWWGTSAAQSLPEALGDTRVTVLRGRSANIFCQFSTNPSTAYDNFYIRCTFHSSNQSYKDVLSCNWEGKPPELTCTEKPGFTFDKKVSDSVMLHTTEQDISDIDKCFNGIVGSRERPNLCNISVQEASLTENSLGEESDGKDRTEQEGGAVNDASGDNSTNLATESDDEKDSPSPALSHGGIAVIIIAAAVFVLAPGAVIQAVRYRHMIWNKCTSAIGKIKRRGY